MAADQRIQILLTHRCNLGCSYCFQDRTSTTRLSEERLRERLTALVDDATVVEVCFSGGDPLLEFELLRNVVHAAHRGEFGYAAYHWSLITNGFLLDRERLDWLRANDFAIQLSVQADPTQPAVADRSHGALRRLLDHGFRPDDQVSIVVVPGGLARVEHAVRFAAKRGATEISLSPDLRPGQSAVESEEEWTERLTSLAMETAGTQGPHPVANFRPAGSSALPLETGTCAASGTWSLAIDANGDVWSCSALMPGESGIGAPETRLGVPGEDGFEERRSTLNRRMAGRPEFLTRPPDSPECAACPAHDECQICPATHLRMRARDLPTPGPFFCGFTRAMKRVRAALRALEVVLQE